MHPISPGVLQDRLASDPRGLPDPAGRIRWGLACSAILHALAILLLVSVFPPLSPSPSPVEVEVAVEVVQSDGTGPSSGRQEAAPQQREALSGTPEPPQRSSLPEAEAEAEAKPQPQEKPPALHPAAPLKRDVPAPPLKRDATPLTRDAPVQPNPQRQKPPRHDDVASLLASVERTHQAVPLPRPQPGDGVANLALPGIDDGAGQPGKRGVKDFIREQIERHWEFDLRDLEAADLVISLHLRLNADGSISVADIVDNPRYSADAHYRSVAISARNAALASSPLHLPPGVFNTVKDITLTLDPRDVLR